MASANNGDWYDDAPDSPVTARIVFDSPDIEPKGAVSDWSMPPDALPLSLASWGPGVSSYDQQQALIAWLSEPEQSFWRQRHR